MEVFITQLELARLLLMVMAVQQRKQVLYARTAWTPIVMGTFISLTMSIIACG